MEFLNRIFSKSEKNDKEVVDITELKREILDSDEFRERVYDIVQERETKKYMRKL